jgi:hypothetical protein
MKTDLQKDTHDRMCEIARLIKSTQDERANVEYSALICVAAHIMAVSNGVKPTYENLGRIGRLIAARVIPAIEAEISRARAD